MNAFSYPHADRLSAGTAWQLIPQHWNRYPAQDHRTWRTLYERQAALLSGRVRDGFLEGLKRLDLTPDGIPDIDAVNRRLAPMTGWSVVCVPGTISDHAFFELLSRRLFPSGQFIRRPDQMDYLQEPDIFHDLFGHVPSLTDPAFADYMQAYGEQGLKSLEAGALPFMARLFWFTVEFGLMRTGAGLRIYGSGIVSSRTESLFCLDSPSSNHIAFDVERIMRTDYFIDDFQPTYFVIDGFDQLRRAGLQDFARLFERLKAKPLIAPGAVVGEDTLYQRGSQSYFLDNGKAHKLTFRHARRRTRPPCRRAEN